MQLKKKKDGDPKDAPQHMLAQGRGNTHWEMAS